MLTNTLKEELITSAVLYHLGQENGVHILNDHWSFPLAEPHFRRLTTAGYIEISDEHYVLTELGRGCISKIVAAMDQVKKFEIFAEVFFMDLDGEMLNDDNFFPGVKDHLNDPRFIRELAEELSPSIEAEDLRLAVMSYVLEAVESTRGREFENYSSVRVVFLQRLLDGDFTGDFWGTLFSGQLLQVCAEIADSQLRWNDIQVIPDDADPEDFSPEDLEGLSWEIVGQIYQAGLLQQKKLNGYMCGTCEAPIALMTNTDAGGNLVCDGCESSFYTPLATEYDYSCPNCHSTILEDANACPSCGLAMDFALSPGEIVEKTEAITTGNSEDRDFWDDDGYYVGYPMYDPYDPVADALAFAIICDVMF